MQPKIPLFYRTALLAAKLEASCYQPPRLFHKNGRKLPNAAEESDPWEVFLRREGEFGIVGTGVGATLPDALAVALRHRSGRGLLPALSVLGEQIDLLTETIRCQ